MKVLQYNIFLRPPGISNAGGDYKDERLQLFIDNVLQENGASFDLIFLQEAFAGYCGCCFGCSGRLDKLRRAAADAGLPYSHSGPQKHWCEGKFLDGGLLILSRFPIEKRDTLKFTAACHSDTLAAKGALHACIRLPGGQLVDVFTAHLQASYSYTPTALVDSTQRLQLTELHEFIVRCCEGRETALFGSDMNIDAMQPTTGEPQYQHLLHALKGEKFSDCIDMLLLKDQQNGNPTQITHPATTVKYTWDTDTGTEVVLDSYLHDENGDSSHGAQKLERKACRLDYLFLLSGGRERFVLTPRAAMLECFLTEQLTKSPYSAETTKPRGPVWLSDHFGIVGEFEEVGEGKLDDHFGTLSEFEIIEGVDKGGDGRVCAGCAGF